MKNVLQSLGLAMVAAIFVHFKNDATGEPVFLNDPLTGKPDPSKPVGVRIYGPGSKEYKAAQSAIMQEAIDEKKKKVTAKGIEDTAVELLARTTIEFVGFTYEGSEDNPLPENASFLERARAFHLDPEYVNLQEQIKSKQGDLGAFLPKATKA